MLKGQHFMSIKWGLPVKEAADILLSLQYLEQYYDATYNLQLNMDWTWIFIYCNHETLYLQYKLECAEGKWFCMKGIISFDHFNSRKNRFFHYKKRRYCVSLAKWHFTTWHHANKCIIVILQILYLFYALH